MAQAELPPVNPSPEFQLLLERTVSEGLGKFLYAPVSTQFTSQKARALNVLEKLSGVQQTKDLGIVGFCLPCDVEGKSAVIMNTSGDILYCVANSDNIPRFKKFFTNFSSGILSEYPIDNLFSELTLHRTSYAIDIDSALDGTVNMQNNELVLGKFKESLHIAKERKRLLAERRKTNIDEFSKGLTSLLENGTQ